MGTTNILMETDFPDLKLLNRGKVRDVYKLDDSQLLMVTTDRLSAFDVVSEQGIPDKGKVLNSMTLLWSERMSGIVMNHIVTADVNHYPESLKKHKDILAGRSMIVRKTEPLKVECIPRGYLSGSSWDEYKKTGKVCGMVLPKGLKESGRLSEPIFTSSTKAEIGDHDENISFRRMIEIIGSDKLAFRIKELVLAIYKEAEEYAFKKGIIIADTKLEFGLCNGQLYLIDEVLTPDSSRFWPKVGYHIGGPQESFDKQFVRNYLNSIGWDRKSPMPILPEEIIRKTSLRYKEALRTLFPR